LPLLFVLLPLPLRWPLPLRLLALVLALMLLPSLAFADTRIAVHAGGGAEAGTIIKDDHPVLAAELGVSASYVPRGKTWGVGLVLERVERREVNVEISEELKLDVMFTILAKHGARFGVGFGVRQLEVPGEGVMRPASTVRGVDVMRMAGEFQLLRFGPVGIDAYFSWTFGAYFGEVYNTRYGDMPYTTRDYTSLTNTYIGGLGTSMTWN
jgi:hypothetical protein